MGSNSTNKLDSMSVHTETISSECLQLIEDLSKTSFINDFYLGGGTALSLEIGHRKSIDLDFFTMKDFSPMRFTGEIKSFGKVTDAVSNYNSYRAFVNGVKLEFMYFAYEPFHEMYEWNGIKMLNPIDIAMFKLLAIIGRNRKKDIVDLFFIDEEIEPLENIFTEFTTKYDRGDINLLKQLELLFDDEQIEKSDMPHMLKSIDWDYAYKHVKESIINAIRKTIFN